MMSGATAAAAADAPATASSTLASFLSFAPPRGAYVQAAQCAWQAQAPAPAPAARCPMGATPAWDGSAAGPLGVGCDPFVASGGSAAARRSASASFLWVSGLPLPNEQEGHVQGPPLGTAFAAVEEDDASGFVNGDFRHERCSRGEAVRINSKGIPYLVDLEKRSEAQLGVAFLIGTSTLVACGALAANFGVAQRARSQAEGGGGGGSGGGARQTQR